MLDRIDVEVLIIEDCLRELRQDTNFNRLRELVGVMRFLMKIQRGKLTHKLKLTCMMDVIKHEPHQIRLAHVRPLMNSSLTR